MKRLMMPLLAVGGLLWMGTASAAPVGEPATWKVASPDRTGHKISVVEFSPEIGKVIQVEMVPAKFPYVEMIPGKGFRFASTEAEFNGTFGFDLFCNKPEAVLTVGIRLLDAGNEVFQYSAAPKLVAGQWNKIRIPLSPKIMPGAVFGGDKNRTLDYPVRLLSVLVDCKRGLEDNVQLSIDDIQWTRVGEEAKPEQK